MIKIIGVAGYARSGKDSVCEFIQEELKELAISSFRYALADPIKYQVNQLFGWDERHSYGELKEVSVEVLLDHETLERVVYENFTDYLEYEGDAAYLARRFTQILDDNHCIEYTAPLSGFSMVTVSPRQMYQLWGTEFARDNICDSIWFDTAEGVSCENQGRIMIVPDVRFLNEAEWINNNPNAVLIGVERPVHSDSIGSTHASEKDIPEVIHMSDCVIDNTGTLGELRETAKIVLKALLGV